TLHSFSLQPPPTPVLYTLSLHDALPISSSSTTASITSAWCARCSSICSPVTRARAPAPSPCRPPATCSSTSTRPIGASCRRQIRSEEHTSELQSLRHLVCRLLLEKKKKQ